MEYLQLFCEKAGQWKRNRQHSTLNICYSGQSEQPEAGIILKFGKKKAAGKTAAEFGWDTSKLQKITLFQARNAPLQRTTVRYRQSMKRANFCRTQETPYLSGFQPDLRSLDTSTKRHIPILQKINSHYAISNLCILQKSISEESNGPIKIPHYFFRFFFLSPKLSKAGACSMISSRISLAISKSSRADSSS